MLRSIRSARGFGLFAVLSRHPISFRYFLKGCRFCLQYLDRTWRMLRRPLKFPGTSWYCSLFQPFVLIEKGAADVPSTWDLCRFCDLLWCFGERGEIWSVFSYWLPSCRDSIYAFRAWIWERQVEPLCLFVRCLNTQEGLERLLNHLLTNHMLFLWFLRVKMEGGLREPLINTK